MQQKMSAKSAALMVFYPMLTVSVTQLFLFHQFWRKHTLEEYRFIMAAMWLGLAVVVIFAVRFARELSHLDREQWRARVQGKRLVNDVQTKLGFGGRHGI